MTTPASPWPTPPIARAAKGETLGPLHGLPIAFKDLQPAVGFPFTRGSLIYKDATADRGFGAGRAAAPRRARSPSARPTPRSSAWGRTPTTRSTASTRNPYDPTQERRRIERRRRRGAGLGHAADRRRQRHGRLAAQPRQLQQRRRHAADRRPGAERAEPAAALRLLDQRAAGAHGRRRRPAAQRDGRARSARPGLRAVRSRQLSRPPGTRACAACASPGAPISAACRSIRACARCWRRSARPSRRSAASSRTPLPICSDADSIFLTIRALPQRRWPTGRCSPSIATR